MQEPIIITHMAHECATVDANYRALSGKYDELMAHLDAALAIVSDYLEAVAGLPGHVYGDDAKAAMRELAAAGLIERQTVNLSATVTQTYTVELEVELEPWENARSITRGELEERFESDVIENLWDAIDVDTNIESIELN